MPRARFMGFLSKQPRYQAPRLVRGAERGPGKQGEQKKPFAENMQANKLHPSSLAPLI